MKFFVRDDLVDTDLFTPFTTVTFPCGCDDDCGSSATVVPTMLQVDADGEVYFWGHVIEVHDDTDHNFDEYLDYPEYTDYPEDN